MLVCVVYGVQVESLKLRMGWKAPNRTGRTVGSRGPSGADLMVPDDGVGGGDGGDGENEGGFGGEVEDVMTG